MPKADIDLILKKIKFLRDDLNHLKKFKNISLAEYMEDDLKRASIERFLEKITGRVIDINYHILREEYEILPEDYYSSFIELGKKGVIPAKIASELARSTGLRNALAHEYDKIDDKKVYQSIKLAISEVPEYLKRILKFLS